MVGNKITFHTRLNSKSKIIGYNFNRPQNRHYNIFSGCKDVLGTVDKYGHQCSQYKKSWCKYTKPWGSSAGRKCCICGGGTTGMWYKSQTHHIWIY